jgi:N-6 DNA Methylase
MVEGAVGHWIGERKAELGFQDLPKLSQEDYESIHVRQTRKKTIVVYNKRVDLHVKTWEAYQQVLSSIRVLDPACGSGAFLIEVFDYLYREGQVINRQLVGCNS